MIRQREKHGHGGPKTPTYITWQDMKDRCNNQNNYGFKKTILGRDI